MAINCPDRKCCKTIQSMSFQQHISLNYIQQETICNYFSHWRVPLYTTEVEYFFTFHSFLQKKTSQPSWTSNGRNSSPRSPGGHHFATENLSSTPLPKLLLPERTKKMTNKNLRTCELKLPSTYVHWDMYPCIIRRSIAYKKMIFI